MFVLETAMDELAYALGIDPVELRRARPRRRPTRAATRGRATGWRSACAAARERFGWAERDPHAARRGATATG